MKEKSNILQIGEVAKLYSISRKMILNYERNGLLVPAYINPYSKYRYYDSENIATIGVILDLRKAGLSILDIRKYFNGKITIKEQINTLTKQIDNLKLMIENLKLRDLQPNSISEIQEITIPETYCVCKSLVAKDIDKVLYEFISLFEKCYNEGYHFTSGYYNFCLFPNDILSPDFYEIENIHVQMCISVEKKVDTNDLLCFPSTKALSISFCGRYDDSNIAYLKLADYIKEHKLEVSGKVREYYIQGNFTTDSNDNIIRIVVPIK